MVLKTHDIDDDYDWRVASSRILYLCLPMDVQCQWENGQGYLNYGYVRGCTDEEVHAISSSSR